MGFNGLLFISFFPDKIRRSSRMEAQMVKSSRSAGTGSTPSQCLSGRQGCIHLQESWKAQEEEVSRLTDEVDLLQQRRQQLREALAAAQQVQLGPEALVLACLSLVEQRTIRLHATGHLGLEQGTSTVAASLTGYSTSAWQGTQDCAQLLGH